MPDLEYEITTLRTALPITGMDVTIFSVPAAVVVNDVPNLLRLTQFSESLAEKQAVDLGEKLHHADFVLTSDPSVVEARGIMHDCQSCREAVRQAIRLLKSHPGRQLVVGALYWCQP